MREIFKEHQYKIIFVLMLLVCTCNASLAQDHESEGHDKHANHYHLSMFAGYTVDYHDKTGYKIGLEYEYRMTESFGLGGTFDFTGADFKIFAFSLGASFYPIKKVPIVMVAGIGGKHKHEEWKPFYRGMLAYDFHVGKFGISPTIIHDFFPESKDITSFGLQFGITL